MSVITTNALPGSVVVQWLEWQKIRVLALITVYTRDICSKLGRVLNRDRFIAMFLANCHLDVR